MSCGPIQILQNPDNIDIKQSPKNIQIFQGVQMVNVCSQSRPASLVPFSFTATEDGQTTFGPWPAIPVNVVTLAITGTLQDPAGTVPDYTWNSGGVTLSQGVNAGNTIYGMIQTA